MTDSPPGWISVPLGEIAETMLGRMLDRKKDTGEHARPYLRNVNVQWGRVDLDDVLTMDIPPSRQETFRLRPGDLLVCEGGEIGRCAVWHGGADYMAFQKALHRVRPYGGIEPQYLRYLFEYLSLTDRLVPFSTGSTIKHLPQEQLRRIPVPLPPLAEQRRIVAALDGHLSRLDAARRTLQDAEQRRRALLARAADRYLGRFARETRPLASVLAEPLANGRSVPTDEAGFPVLRLTALRDGRLDLAERKGGRWSRAEAEPFLVRKGDFFISRGNGSISLVGRGALLEEDPDPVAFPDTMIRIRVAAERMRPRFLRLVWESRSVRRQIERSARTTAGIYKINQRTVEGIEIPVPGIGDQDAVIAELTELQEGLRRYGHLVSRAEARAGRLRGALLAEAFTGRLVPQDPEDEPASALLARIEAERAGGRASRRRARRTAKPPAAAGPGAAVALSPREPSPMPSTSTPIQETLL